MTSIPRNTTWGTAAETIEQLVEGAIDTAVIDANAYTDEQLDAFEVYPERTTFYDLSTNLLNLDTATAETGMTTTGEPAAADGQNLTDYFRVKGGTTYAMSFVRSMATYDENREFLQRTAPANAENHTYTTPSGAVWARAVVDDTYLTTAQLNEGNSLLPYERGHSAQVTGIDRDVMPEVRPQDTTFFTVSTNLFVKDTVTASRTISQSTGELTSNATHSASDWIRVTPQRPYTFTNIARWAWYDEDKQFIKSRAITSSPWRKIAPPDAAWLRVSVANANLETAQVNEGLAAPPYEEGYAPYLDPEYVPSPEPSADPDNALTTGTDGKLYVPTTGGGAAGRTVPILDTPVDAPWEIPFTIPSLASEIASNATPAGVYAMYDDLVTNHPDYVTRTDLGDVTYGGDTWPMYRYDFKPEDLTLEGGSTVAGHPAPLHRILVLTSTHGFERLPIWTMHRLCQEMCDNWDTDPAFATLRFNCHFTVVPVANPYGLANNTRWNGNLVDPARNYPANWVQGTEGQPTYGGPEPTSEVETQYVMGILDEIEDEAVAVIDFHSFSGTVDTDYFVWTPPANPLTGRIATAHIRRMDRIWKVSQSDIVPPGPETTTGTLGPLPGGGVAQEANARGIPVALTYEHGEQVRFDPAGSSRDSRAATMGFEAWTNFLLQVLANWHKG